MNGLLHEGTPEGVFVRRRDIGVTEGMVKLAAAHDAIRPDACGDRIQAGRQYRGNTNAFTFFGDRSPATSAGASRGRQDHSADPAFDQYTGDLCSHPFHGVQTAEIANRHEQFVQQLAD
jgi:hypothetical protein